MDTPHYTSPEWLAYMIGQGYSAAVIAQATKVWAADEKLTATEQQLAKAKQEAIDAGFPPEAVEIVCDRNLSEHQKNIQLLAYGIVLP